MGVDNYSQEARYSWVGRMVEKLPRGEHEHRVAIDIGSLGVEAFYPAHRSLFSLGYNIFFCDLPIYDICNLPIHGHSIDLVILSHVLEHVPDDEKALKDVWAILKLGGHCIFSSPVKKTWVEYSKPDPAEWGHARSYSKERMVDLAGRASFGIMGSLFVDYGDGAWGNLALLLRSWR